MTIEGWDERYRLGEYLDEAPTPLVARAVSIIAPGRALDLACGPGRNAIHLAKRGWQVSAVDGSRAAIDMLRRRANEEKLAIDARVADLEGGAFAIQPDGYDLILDCYYLQRNLFPAIRAGVRPGGWVVAIVHIVEESAPDSGRYRMDRGELRAVFSDWKILHDYEGAPGEECHRRAVAEIVAQRPGASG